MSKTVPLEEQLRVLAECGIRCRPGITVAHIVQPFPRETYERDPYTALSCTLGSETEDDAAERLSDNIWHFDAECIYDDSDYIGIAARMCILAGGDLPLESVEDRVDAEGGKAWLSFRLDGRPIKWDLRLDDDWVDPTVFSRFASLLAARGTGKRFTYLDLGGQDCLIGGWPGLSGMGQRS